jgi:hypothetical protein
MPATAGRALRFAAAAAAVQLLAGCMWGDRTHEDDYKHPLSMGSGAVEISVHPPEDRSAGASWSATFGSFFPCVAQSDETLTITGISWSSEDGLEPESVATFARSFDRSAEMPIGSMRGTADEPLDADLEGLVQEGAEGFEVTLPCDEAHVGDRGVIDEILFSVTAGDGGGHIGEVRFTYETEGGRTYTLQTESNFYVCGTAAPEHLECP